MVSVELRCFVCPSQPTFSDQSHLLTHIGSKGHLSHYFKVQVRSRQDSQARALLRKYDDWYDSNGIEELLSQRLKTKETKITYRKAATPKESQTKKRVGRKKHASAEDDMEYDLQAGSALDPRLHDHKFLPTPHALGSIKNREGIDMSCCHVQRAPIAHMQAKYCESAERLLHISAQSATEPCTWHSGKEESMRGVTQPHREYDISVPGFGKNKNLPAILDSGFNDYYSTAASKPEHVGFESTDNYAPGDPAILKGVIWPGMNLFDTADVDSRRKRNQKKSESTLLQMETESQTFEPTEAIYFYPSWNLKKTRFISGEVESSPSPESDQGGAPPTNSRARSPLLEMDPNVITTKKPKRQQKGLSKTCKESFKDSLKDKKRNGPDHTIPAEKLKRRRHAFKVFQDAPNDPPNQVQPTGTVQNSELLDRYKRSNQTQGMSESPNDLDPSAEQGSNNITFFDSSLLNTPSLIASDIRESPVFKMEPQQDQNSAFFFEPNGLPETNGLPQRFFTMAPNDPPSYQSSAPLFADMAISYAAHCSLNPFHAHQSRTMDLLNFDLGSISSSNCCQDPPIEFRQLPRYTVQRNSPISEGAGSDATIDQGIEDTMSLLER